MTSTFNPAVTVHPVDEPTCCHEAFLCLTSLQIDCPRHGAVPAVCCDRRDLHVPQTREGWNKEMETWERALLDAYIRRQTALEHFFGPADRSTIAALDAAI